MTITEIMHDIGSAVSTYTAVALSYLAGHFISIPWMSIGAAILLTARLIQDVPKAYVVIRNWLRKRNTLKE